MRIMSFIFLIISFTLGFGQSTGKIIGTITDKTSNEPLEGVRIYIDDYNKEFVSDEGGFYIIPTIPVGVHNLEVISDGYKKVVIDKIHVSSDDILEINFQMELLSPDSESKETIILDANSELAKYNSIPGSSIITSEEIERLPVRGLQNILSTQPGAYIREDELYFRGGSSSGIGYYLNGFSTLDPLYRSNAVHIIPEAIEEVQVNPGVYSAKYGNANSGIVLTDLKTGTNNYRFSLNSQTDKYVRKGEEFLGAYSYRDHIITATASGPIFTENLRFFMAIENESIGDTRKRFSSGFEFND